ncbi:type II toxin-antitoxin system VapC family toxin [Mycobacterium sp. KBS0706]|uniref:type II toxin-antitoxin system VapC family toxin n=1 Tax=Mycobacterium sp. KBS0706 TaxID=2578109 RepID=UPI00110FED50|nr:type II toxin-antitoxin system VapC family toxin [Mycobacterium sp. KBS0706]TSD84398.1 type II toxin-antitoxin system VapC family toxin [Mycobacterium sp. KBS0706]
MTAGYLLDTNILSETRRTRAEPRVLSFLSAADPAQLFVSVLTIGELRKGIEVRHRSDAKMAAKLSTWAEALEASFADRVLAVDTATAKLWGVLSADRPRPVIDTLLAATAIVHDLTLVTRNAADVAGTGVSVLNPWP